ncbi:hypothetical protein PBI_KALPINE_8 [Mycobacterium phage Kalpine]|nr:hypothetical protein PBI_KALPINE_8 [Mycobacterium phage Kalpine]
MPISLGSTSLSTFRVGTLTPDRIFLGNELVWPAFTEATQQFASVGTWTYTIPTNCRFIDIVIVGAGGGGAGGANIGNGDGKGGKAGAWQTITLRRGVDIPWSTTQITVVISAGGTGGGSNNGAGGNGGTTSISVNGTLLLIALGGAGGSGINPTGGSDPIGQGAGTQTYNGKPYVGGSSVGVANPSGTGTTGSPPGGGGEGGGGALFGTGSGGGPGAPGGAWVRAY